jgi:hypothetical protein
MRDYDCVEERPLRLDTGVPLTRGPSIWHVAKKRGRSSDFAPIRCSVDEGIVCHGGIFRREPTCPDCIAALRSPIQGGESE